jgi:acetyltransferase-like isoleucine patch superfamily enzyme
MKTTYLIIRTQIYVRLLQLCGRKIKIGKGTIFDPSSSVSPGNGVIIMGKNCYIGRGTIIRSSHGKICFGDNIHIGEYSILHGHGKIYIGDNGLLATHISLVPAHHNFSHRDIPIKAQGHTKSGIWIGEDVWLGSGARVLDGIRIGKGAVVGAGSVVTKNIGPYSINAGNPARKLRDRD